MGSAGLLDPYAPAGLGGVDKSGPQSPADMGLRCTVLLHSSVTAKITSPL
jgi:hypothetical protein